MRIYPKNLKNRLLGLAKAPIIDDRKLVRIALIRTNLRNLRSSILGSFRGSRKTDFSGSLGIARLFLLALIVLTIPKTWNAIKGADSHLFSKNLVRTEKNKFIPKQLAGVLAQPFYYWGKGSQFYVYLSADGLYVLKFPRASKLRESLLDRILRRKIKKPDLLTSLQIAYENLALQTGLISVHFERWIKFKYRLLNSTTVFTGRKLLI